MTVAAMRCTRCGARVEQADRFCEECGRDLAGERIALPPTDSVADGPCRGCGGEQYDVDGYCTACGELWSAPDRHAAAVDAVAVITDRGLVHARNEDSVAAIVMDGVTIVVVADGVSTSEDPRAASGAATRAGAEATRLALVSGAADPEAAMAGLSAAAEAVRVVAAQGQAPSCTYVSAIVRTTPSGTEVTTANVGDSRAYWLCGPTGHAAPPPDTELVDSTPSDPADRAARPTPWSRAKSGVGSIPASNPPVPQPTSGSVSEDDIPDVVDSRPAHRIPRDGASQRLTLDDSWAQALVTAGAMDERAAMNDPRAHMLLRWLGADAGPRPWAAGCVRTVRVRGAGVLLVCSDGLWNYAPEAEELAARVAGAAPMRAARDLVDFAVACGGGDNITVAIVGVAPSGGMS
ncbi:zinc-ribbon domain-containing protein [Nocardia panacis]|uniref:zinc-ribbon domain-containing protein n=1 Tax=Nocardia panacis TaxID=2340916 RepID=UPI001EF093F6|nr:zinc-ribbon domain-containing protein [Nocardia panacis]